MAPLDTGSHQAVVSNLHFSAVHMFGLGSLTLFRAAGRALSNRRLLDRFPALSDAIDRLRHRLLNPVVTRLIRDPDDSDLEGALKLYEERIPDDQRFDPTDIVRWLREDIETRRYWRVYPTDWFIVAKYRKRVAGFVLFHYYPQYRFAFCAYMVIAKPPAAPPDAVSAKLCYRLSKLLRTRKELASCRRIILEVEDPREERDRDRQDEAMARIRRFCFLAEMYGLTMRALDIKYRQPRLALGSDDGTERSLLLMSAPVSNIEPQETVDRNYVERILTFIYTALYPEGFSTEPAENDAYRGYCSHFAQEMIAQLPPRLGQSSAASLCQRFGSWQANNRGRRWHVESEGSPK